MEKTVQIKYVWLTTNIHDIILGIDIYVNSLYTICYSNYKLR